LGEKPVIFAFSDATSLLLAGEYETVKEWGVVVMSDLQSIEIAADKVETNELAKKLSIPVIRTYTEEEFGTVSFPCVVKNKHSIVWKDGVAVSGSAHFVFTLDELQKTFTSIMQKTGEKPLVMDFVIGEEYGVEMVCDNGRIVSGFSHLRIRSLSPRGGAAVVKKTAEVSEEVTLMEQYAAALVRELAWTGPVMVEFKKDERDGRVVLMEINGRFWGSLPLALTAGAEFVWQTYQLALGEHPSSTGFVRTYARTRHLLGDLKWTLSVFFASDPLRKKLYPSRLRALFDFKKELFLSSGDIFSLKDPMPALYEYIDILNR
jgi:carbamoylphosphate synthase large subunit